MVPTKSCTRLLASNSLTRTAVGPMSTFASRQKKTRVITPFSAATFMRPTILPAVVRQQKRPNESR
jgi:hypothetical protein